MKKRGFRLVTTDQCIVKNDFVPVRAWSKVGRRIYRPYYGRSSNTVVMGFRTEDGRSMFVRGEHFDKWFVLDALKKMLARFGKVALLLDRASPHTSDLIIEFAKKNKRRLDLRYYPTGCSELNGSEHFWGRFRAGPVPLGTYESVKERERATMEFFRTTRFNIDIDAYINRCPLRKDSKTPCSDKQDGGQKTPRDPSPKRRSKTSHKS